MSKKLFILCFMCLCTSLMFAQGEINAVVTINSDKIPGSNKQVYRTLQTSLTEFINQTKWTNKNYVNQERVKCVFNIIINSQDNNNFSASLQIQSMRPVYGTSYETPVLNINDTNFNFRYVEFAPLVFNPNSFDSNLVSTIVFYVYTILAVDADTFALNGGKDLFKKAENVMLFAQQNGGNAWQNEVGTPNRFALIDSFLSPKFSAIHRIYYEYHRQGLDYLGSDETKAKNQIVNSVSKLNTLHNITVGNYLLRIFLDAKADEIVNTFSGGKPSSKVVSLKETLVKIAPTKNNKWRAIK